TNLERELDRFCGPGLANCRLQRRQFGSGLERKALWIDTAAQLIGSHRQFTRLVHRWPPFMQRLLTADTSSHRTSAAASCPFSPFPAVFKPLHLPHPVGLGAAWSLDGHGCPFALSDQRPGDR